MCGFPKSQSFHPEFCYLAAPVLEGCILPLRGSRGSSGSAPFWFVAPPGACGGRQAGKRELMRYLAELARAPHTILHNPQLSWCEIDATTVEVSYEPGRPGTGAADLRER